MKNHKCHEPNQSHAPFRIFNVGNSSPTKLMNFINLLEEILGKKAKITYLPLQAGDVESTFSDSSNLIKYINFRPETILKIGLESFIEWFKNYYK